MSAQSGKLSAEQKLDVVRRAGCGETITAIANDFGVSRAAINGILRRRGVPARRAGKLSDDQRREAVRRYVAGETVAELALAYGVTQPAIRSLVVLRGVHRPQIRTLRHDAFDELTDEAKYWAGFLFADGTIHYRAGYAPHVGVVLAARDREHLVALREFLGSSNRVCTAGTQKRANQFAVHSERLAERLLHLGRYSGNVDDALVSSRHFWRGVVDGDGSVGVYARPGVQGQVMPQFKLVGSLRLLEAFRAFLGAAGIDNLSITPHKSIFIIGTTCKPALTITALLYSNAGIALARKAETARKMLALSGNATSPEAVSGGV